MACAGRWTPGGMRRVATGRVGVFRPQAKWRRHVQGRGLQGSVAWGTGAHGR